MENHPLDDDFIINLETLKIGPEGSGFLHVNQGLWKEELYSLERKANLGCVAFFAIIIFFAYYSFSASGLLFLAVLVLGFIFNRMQAIRYNNLRMHGAYQYEIYEDRIVRYSNTWYRKYHKFDLLKIQHKNYGILITQKRGIRNFFLNHVNPNIIVIPKKVQGFPQIVKHISKWEIK